MKPSRSRRSVALILDRLDDRCMLSAGLTPAQLATAYGYSAIKIGSGSGSVTATGTGQTIALIEAYHDPTLAADLHHFDLTYHLPDPNLQVANLAGNQYNAGWAGEESLDVEWAHALAPGANLVVIEAASQNLTDLMNAVQAARNDAAVTVVSMSWGFGEIANERSYDPFFTTPAGHQGITYIAASGDNGTVEYPSSSPNVVAVGGTSLYLNSASAYSSETAWYATGGGYSVYEGEPTYQASVQSTGRRSTPDVAFNADPNTGVMVFQTINNVGTWQVVGGTSLGAPAWAALIALVDQGRASAGLGSLDGPTQTLPALYAAPPSAFHSPALLPQSGGFSFGFEPFGFYGQGGLLASFGGSVVTPGGANTETGLGSPNAPALYADLVSSTLVTPIGTVGPSVPVSTNPTAPIRHHKQHKIHAPRHKPLHKAPPRFRHSHARHPRARFVHQPVRAAHHEVRLITLSKTDWSASGDTLNSPRNGLSIAAVKNTRSPINTARIAIRNA